MKQKINSTNQFLRQKGQSLVETALVLPVLIILIAGAVEASSILITKNRIESAARAAARFASKGGDDVEQAALDSVTGTLQLNEGVWDIWLVEGQLTADGLDFASWNADGDTNDIITNTQIYGAITPTTKYTDIVRIIGDDCIRDPDPINVSDPGANKCIRDQVLADLRRDIQGAGTPGTSDLAGLRIGGIYISHDIESILGLNAFPAFQGILSVNGFGVMRTATATPSDATAGCQAAWPIGFERGLRSLTAATYPGSSSFDYPANPPILAEFPSNGDGDVSIDNAKEGYVYLLTGNDNRYAWLKWNSGIVDGNNTLANSLTWPGDSWDYSDQGDAGSAFPPFFNHVVRGYINVGITDDQSMHIPDRVSPNTTATMSGVTAQLQNHIDTGRVLQLIALPVGGGTAVSLPAPDNRPYHVIDGFALFRLHGYSVSEDWLLVEFISWDESCGQES